MPGLQLMGRGGVGVSSGNYAPLTPASATPSTASIAQQAYGISGGGASNWNDDTAWVGSVAFGVFAVALLGYLWWSLPR